MVNVTTDASGSLVATDRDGKVTVYSPGDLAWTLTSTALVWLMIPGVGFLYSGLLRRKNALSMIYLSVMTIMVVSIQWFFWGFSLAFSDSQNGFIGDLRYLGLKGVLEDRAITSPKIPSILFCAFQLMFAAFTPMIAIGAVAERGRIGPLMVFVFIWSTLVYDPIAYWVWNPNGWSSRLGSLDFAGGTPVHISSGATALAMTIRVGQRRGFRTEALAYSAHSISYVGLGTALVWFGWFGFNGGSALSANLRATNAVIVTNLAACSGGLTYAFVDYRWRSRKWGMVSLCSGAIGGLIAITPAAGFVGAPAAVLFGVVAGVACNFSTDLIYWLNIDDVLDIGAFHVVGGFVGNILTGMFAQASIAGSDGVTHIKGGWLDHNWMQVVIQLADSAAGGTYAFVVTTLILVVMERIPGLKLRVTKHVEWAGVDFAETGENFDDVNVEMDQPPTPDPEMDQRGLCEDYPLENMDGSEATAGRQFQRERPEFASIAL